MKMNFCTDQHREHRGGGRRRLRLYSLPVAGPSLLVSVFSLEEKGNGCENSVPWSGGQPAIMQRRSRPHLRINGPQGKAITVLTLTAPRLDTNEPPPPVMSLIIACRPRLSITPPVSLTRSCICDFLESGWGFLMEGLTCCRCLALWSARSGPGR